MFSIHNTPDITASMLTLIKNVVANACVKTASKSLYVNVQIKKKL